MQQFQLTKQKEFRQVLSNVANVTKIAVENTKAITVDTVLQLQKVLDSVQQTLRALLAQGSNLTLTSSVQYLLNLQARFTSALKLVSPLSITSTTA